MYVLGQIDTTLFDCRIHFLKRDDLLPHGVAPIVDHDIERAVFLAKLGMCLPVLLVANDNFDAGFSKRCATRIDVHANNLRLRPKIMLPHLQRAAMKNAVLQQPYRLAAESAEMSLVNTEVVPPLVNKAAGIIIKIAKEVAHQVVYLKKNIPIFY